MTRLGVRQGVALVAGGATVLASLAGAAATTVALQVVTPPRTPREPVRVLRVQPQPGDASAGTITLQRTIESEVAGEYSLLWDGGAGRARLGVIVTADVASVTRRYSDAEGTPLAGVRAVRVASAPHRHVRDLRLPWRDVAIGTEVGELPAWFVPAAGADRGDWVIHVHGRGAALTEPLRTVPVVHELGWHSLVVHYRNDAGTPVPAKPRYGLGATEWRDVEAAMEWARARGAQRFVLSGWSMGGAIVAQTYLNSPLRDRIAGLMLESPALDWREILAHQTDAMHIPAWVSRIGARVLGSPLHGALLGTPEPISQGALDLVARAGEFDVPVLLLHSAADTVVPVNGSRRFAQARPDLVTYVEFATARHTRLWNVDRQRWERAVHDWFAALSAAARAPR